MSRYSRGVPIAALTDADSYSTPPGIPQAARERMLLGSRWSPYSFFLSEVLRCRALALKGAYGDDEFVRSSLNVLRGLERCGARFEISGLDRIRSAPGPVVLVGNHMSTLETLVLPGLVFPIKPATFVVKRKLVKGFFWGPIMRSRDPIVVRQRSPREDLETVLKEGAARLSRGMSVIVFPEGTRARRFRRENFNSLAIRLAAGTGALVAPVALKTDYWGNGLLLRGFGPVRRDRVVRFEFGEAVPVSGRGKAEHERCVGFIEERLRRWAVEDAEQA